ncbi:MAG TPA: 4-aminobutyrate--2-oxoglutarate transaminase [Thermoanaerobaculia bacterium]|nr:4-aminobutyrate--2-oxoglutarate transaminase [Thermoanaerobaculia bacterium]
MSHSKSQADLLARREKAVSRGTFHIAPLFAARGKGALLWDVDGKEYVDFCGGIGVLNVGHCHPRVIAAIREQSERFVHTCWNVAMYEPYVELAERLNDLAPIAGEAKSVFFNSGAEANENAVKIARVATGRQGVVAFERGFHGRTLLTMTMTGKVRPYSAGFGPFAPEVYRLPYEPFFAPASTPDSEVDRACGVALEHLFAYHAEPEAIACLVIEPVLGEGGFLPVHPAAFRVLRETCDRHGIVLVADEVQTGFGRCGALFACERYGVRADLVLMAKSLGAGLPLSAVTGRAELMDASPVGGIGGTYGGNPVACAAALAVLDVIEEEDLCARAEVIGERVRARFEELCADHAALANARGLGAMCALDVVDPRTQAPDVARATRLLAHAQERGLLAMTANGNAVRTLMPLVITDEQLDRGLDALAAAAGAIAEETATVSA